MIAGTKQFFLVMTFILALACPLTSAAAEKNALVSSSGDPTESNTDKDTIHMNKTIKMESKQPMNPDEPMPTGMAKKGMKKGDVKVHAMKKEAAMGEMMKQEEMKK